MNREMRWNSGQKNTVKMFEYLVTKISYAKSRRDKRETEKKNGIQTENMQRTCNEMLAILRQFVVTSDVLLFRFSVVCLRH